MDEPVVTQEAPQMNIDEFVNILGKKHEFIAATIAQTKKDIGVLEALGMNKKEISKAVGLMFLRGPKSNGTPSAAKKEAKPKPAEK